MLQDIRDRATSWVAYIIIGLLILSFAMWGIQEYFGGGGAQPVANINGNEITLPQFNQQVQQRKQVLQSILGENYQQQYPNENIVRLQVIQDMVRTELLRQEVDDAGYEISDANLIKRIQQIPQFQKDGKFDPELYKRLLESQRINQAQWENELREDDKLRQFENSIAASSFIPKGDLQRFQSISEQTRDFKYALVTINADEVNISDDEIENYYNENKRFYTTPEQVKLAYIELKEQDIADNINVGDEEAKSIYESQLERYMSAELRKARHIMLKVASELESDAMEWDLAMDKANELVQQLKDGADFAELAKQHSEDSLSAEKGGDMGFIAPGDFTSKELEDALFSLKVGENSKAVRTEQGVQILQLVEIEEPKQELFEVVREKIINERKSQLAQERFIEIADEIANLVVEQPDDLQEASESFELPINETEFLSSSSNGEIFTYPKVKNVAFSDDILGEKLNSDLIEVADGHVIAFRVAEHKTSEQKPLADVKNDINNVLKVRKAAESATQKGSDLFLKLKGGESLETLASENNFEVVSHGAIRRDDNRVPFQISDRAFSMEKPAKGKSTADGVAQADGSYALIELSAVTPGSSEVDDTKVQLLSQRVNYGRREFSAIIDAIQAEGEVQIFENQVTADQ